MPHNSTLTGDGSKTNRPIASVGSIDDSSLNAKGVLVDAGSSCPVEHVDQFPWVLCEVPLQLALAIEH